MIPFVSMQSIQTTPYVAFRQGRMGGNPGQCNIAGPNPLIGWRKGIGCCPPHNTRWQEVIKNTCCTPPIKRIQNLRRFIGIMLVARIQRLAS